MQKRRRGSWWSIYWCFSPHRQTKRIGHAVLVPETTTEVNNLRVQNSNQAISVILPFVVPPSSPASFLLSECPSAAQSPAGSVSLSANMYSPGGPASIFAIGPYAHETQLVSPPVFSTFTTEPSTAPFTPPPESLQLTTPSSPEVPFARLLGPTQQSGESSQKDPFSHYEFHSYQLYPGSPIGQLISPSSGTSSPFLDRDFAPCDGFVLHRQKSDISLPMDVFNGLGHNGIAMSGRVSFEVTAEEVVRCVKNNPAGLPTAVSTSLGYVEGIPKREDNLIELTHNHERYQKHRSITLGSSREFKFDGADGENMDQPIIVGCDRCASEKVTGPMEIMPCENWSFFPVLQ